MLDNIPAGVDPVGPVGGGDPTAQADPTPIELSDDSLVKVPGVEKPVKYGEYYKGLQANQTRATQEAARYRQQYEQAQQAIQQREAALAQYQRALQQRQGGQPQGQPSIVDKLRNLTYLSGEEAATVVEDVLNRVAQQDQALQQRDLALIMLHKQLQDVKRNVGSFNEQRVNQEFDGKINRWVSELGLPPEAKDLAAEIYLAYEGEGLDDEFPTILKQRWDAVANAVRQMDRSRVQAARQLPFTPGKGGQASPSQPLNQGYKSPRQLADELFPLVQEGPAT